MQILQKFDSGLFTFTTSKDRPCYREIVRLLSFKGAYIKNRDLEICSYNKILIATIAVEQGVDILSVCKHISWHDFEIFASEIMKRNDYVVYNNYRMKKPTREIDIVGIKSGNALLVDCKHWRSTMNLKKVVERQKSRSVQFMKQTHLSIEKFFPVVITFQTTAFKHIDYVPIVPINLLNSFLLDFDDSNHYLFRV